MATKRRTRKFNIKRISRDTILFTGGLLAFAHQVLIADEAQAEIIMCAMGMMGLPAFFRSDEKKKDE